MQLILTQEHKDHLKEFGYVVIEDVITKEEANSLANDAIQWILDRYPDVTSEYKTWTPTNVPYIRANGVIQWGGLPHCPTAWRVRELMLPYYVDYLGTDDIITSLDGCTISPPRRVRPLSDWAHLDGVEYDIDVLQGQMVLSDTNASFVCTSTSNKYHTEILNKYLPKDKPSGFLRFNDQQVEELKQMFGPNWQVPIIVPAGSIILWDSRTIHSSRLQPQEDRIDGFYNPDNIDGWRVVFYCCYRRRSEHTRKSITNHIKATTNGFGTNHSGERKFPKYGRFTKQYSESMLELLNYPELQEIPDVMFDYLFINKDQFERFRSIYVREIEFSKSSNNEGIKRERKNYNNKLKEYFSSLEPRDNLHLFLSSELKQVIRNINKTTNTRLKLSGNKDELVERLRTYYRV